MNPYPIVYAVVPSAGSGRRFGGSVKKQYLLLQQKEILIHTIEALKSVPEIQGIIIPAAADDLTHCKNLIQQYSFSKICQVLPGGTTRQESVYQGLLHIPLECDIVVIHDGVRPLTPPALIQETIAAACHYGGAVAAVPTKDTIKEADENGFISRTPSRSLLWNAQTPQAFQAAPLREAYEKAFSQGDLFLTDDSQVVEKYSSVPVKLIPGSYENLKITTPEDLPLAELILKNRSFPL